ncbi:unnamed protein product, partial [Mesorhabditis spiculigera]
MFDAYSIGEVGRSLKVELCSIRSQKTSQDVLASCKEGHLLIFGRTASRFRFDFKHMRRNFERKPVVEMAIVETMQLLFCMSDQQLSVHQFDTDTMYPLIAQLKLKPIHTFAVHQNTDDASVKVAVAVKRRIHVFKDCKCTTRAVMSFLDTPIITYLEDRAMIGFAAGKNFVTVPVDAEAKTRKDVRFSEALLNLVWDPPFVVGLLPKGLVEIRTYDSPQLIQSFTLKQAHLLTNAVPGCVVVGSLCDIWMLDCHENLRNNVSSLIKDARYPLAIQLADQFAIFTDDQKKEIKRQYATYLFSTAEYDECYAVFSDIGSDIGPAIQLIPELLPPKVQQLSPSPQKELPENEKKRAIQALSVYLAKVRTDLARSLEQHQQAKHMNVPEGRLSKEEHEAAKANLQIVDTTLLKCYIRTKPMMVDSLLRLRDNACWFPDAEDIIKKSGRNSSLFVLYETRRKHEMALELLKGESLRPDCDAYFAGPYKTVEYLQTLGNNEIDLIFKYSKWVLDADVEEGLAIFTSPDSDLASNLDREKVVDFLQKDCVAALIPYLEHIISAWGEQRPKFHECLAEHYVAKVKSLHKDYVHAFPDDETIIRAGTEDGELGEYRRKLLKFLENSRSYSPQTVLVQLSNQAFYEERALMLGRLGQHEQALTIYTSILHDYEAAEKYCALHYNQKTGPQIYLQLFEAFVSPKDPQIAGLSERQIPIPEPNVKQAIRILSRHADKIDTVAALRIIPDSTPLQLLSMAISAVIQATHDEATKSSIRRRMCECARAVTEEKLRKVAGLKVDVNNMTECALCNKKIGNSALVRDPQSQNLMHVFCYENSIEAATMQ